MAVGEKAAPHILRSVSFMNCELQYPKPGNHSDVEKYRSVLKKCPRSLVSQSPEKSGGGDLGSCKKPRLGRLADG